MMENKQSSAPAGNSMVLVMETQSSVLYVDLKL